MANTSAKRKLFLQKGDYKTCHVLLKETQEHIAAITLDQQYYTFFRTVSDRNKALDLLAKLYDKDSDAIITQAPKAYTVWILETEAVAIQDFSKALKAT